MLSIIQQAHHECLSISFDVIIVLLVMFTWSVFLSFYVKSQVIFIPSTEDPRYNDNVVTKDFAVKSNLLL